MSDLQFQQLESLWRSFQLRLKAQPDLSVAIFAAEHPDCQDDINKLFPMMKGLSEYAKDPMGSPKTIGSYEVVRQIGIGGMGIVYEATSESIRERVAIKVVESSMAGGNNERLAQEARLAATLHHSNIVPVYEFGEYEQNHFYTMKLINGPNLAEVLHSATLEEIGESQELTTGERRALEVADALAENWAMQIDLIRDAAKAIEYAHENDILHRDVKPANLLIGDDFKVWVTDFGLAKFRSPSLENDSSVRSKVMGTPRYMAPEQIRGEADERSDIFGLGLTLYEMSLLQKSGGNARKPIWRGGLRPPTELNPSVPVALERIIMKAVSLDPEDRYRTVTDFITALNRFENRKTYPIDPLQSDERTTGDDRFEELPFGPDDSRQESKRKAGSAVKWLLLAAGIFGLFATSNMWWPSPAGNGGGKGNEIASVTPGQTTAPKDKPNSTDIETPIKPETIPPRTSPSQTVPVTQPPSFSERMFSDDGTTIEIPIEKAKIPVSLEFDDEKFSTFDGLHVTIIGGSDCNLVVVTPSGSMLFARPISLAKPLDSDGDNQYEIEVQVENDTRSCFLRCESEGGKLRLVKDMLASGAKVQSTTIAEDIKLPPGLIDLATADGKQFFHLHRDNVGTAALYSSKLKNGRLTTKLINAETGVSSRAIGLATLDGTIFMVATPGSGNRISVSKMELVSGNLVELSQFENSRLSSRMSGLSWLDESRFQFVRSNEKGEGEFFFSFFEDKQFLSMPLSKASQFSTRTMGSAGWIEIGPNSQTTTRTIKLKVVGSR